MQRKEQLGVSALGNEKLGWGGQWEPPARTWGEGAPSRSAGGQVGGDEGNWITPKYPGSHSRHQTGIPDMVSEVPDAKMLFVFQSAAGEAGDGQGSAHMAGTGESRVSVGTAPKSSGTAPGRIN